ncbi:MAG: hypothetical protein IPH86_12750 [bacterium]|nr:hypothetical protein [bacterium]
MMDDLGSRILAVIVVNGAIAVVQWLVRKQIPTIGRDGQFGIPSHAGLRLAIGRALYTMKSVGDARGRDLRDAAGMAD